MGAVSVVGEASSVAQSVFAGALFRIVSAAALPSWPISVRAAETVVSNGEGDCVSVRVCIGGRCVDGPA